MATSDFHTLFMPSKNSVLNHAVIHHFFQIPTLESELLPLINNLGSLTNDMKRDNGGYLMAGSVKCENGGCRHNFTDDGEESANREFDTGNTTVTVIAKDFRVLLSQSSQVLTAWMVRLLRRTKSAFNRRVSCHVSWLFVVLCLCVICQAGSDARVYDVTRPEGKCIFVLSILIRGYLLDYVVGFTGFTALGGNVFKVRKFREMGTL